MPHSLLPALLGLAGFMLALCHPAQAQSNWVTGYVVTNGGDTLRGQVDDRDWQRSPESVRFRQMDQTGELTYPVGDVQAFFVGPAAQRYLRRVGPLNMDDPKASFLPEKPTPTWVADTVFGSICGIVHNSSFEHTRLTKLLFQVVFDTASRLTD